MSNIERYKSAKTDNTNSLILVRNPVIKTHCIVCNSAFTKPRAGKLYCSNRCKQFGYNHKEIRLIESAQVINPKNKPFKKFRLEEYANFNEMVTDLKKYKELSKRHQKFQEEEHTMLVKSQMGIEIKQNYTLDHFLRQLNKDELYELQYFNSNYPEMKYLEAPSLTIEQWSFFKCLFNKLDEWDFFKTVCQISKDYISQLTLKSNTSESLIGFTEVQEKYVNHCNQITERIIRFH